MSRNIQSCATESFALCGCDWNLCLKMHKELVDRAERNEVYRLA